jgi:Flp pilus assembly protein TadB
VLSVLIPSLGLVIVAVIGLFGQLAASRNERTVTQQEIELLELLQKLDPTSTAAKHLREVIEARVRHWHDKVVQQPGKASTVARTDLFHLILYWVGGIATVLVVLLLVISLLVAGVEWLLGVPIR